MDIGTYKSVTRVLLVEDHEPFRRFIRTFLGVRHDLDLVDDAPDGLSGVQKCVELRPDLVLLDIGLPRLNGIQAARQIRQLVPGCRIVFLTQETSVEIVQEALSLGATGYVIKAQTASDLIPAITAARDGRKFVSPTVDGHKHQEDPDSRSFSKRSSFCPSDTNFRHEVHFYPDDSTFVSGISRFIERSLKNGKVVLTIVDASQLIEIVDTLQSRGVDMLSASERDRFLPINIADLTAEFMVNGRPDVERLLKACTNLVENVKRKTARNRICVCGACVSALLAQGSLEATMQLERAWDEIGRRHDLELFCCYILSSAQRAQQIEACRQIASLHSQVAQICD
jgi:DNA-binding NarL/FixJ family response regulator